jgi:hypothetical protein
MSVSDFENANLAETLEYIGERAKAERHSAENPWKAMRWQSTLILNMMSSKGKSYKPTDLFTFDDEMDQVRKPVAVDSPEAEAVFKKMEEKYLKRWQSG